MTRTKESYILLQIRFVHSRHTWTWELTLKGLFPLLLSLWLCICVIVYVIVHMCICVYLWVCVCICVCNCAYVYICVCVLLCICVCMCVVVYMCVYMCVCGGSFPPPPKLPNFMKIKDYMATSPPPTWQNSNRHPRQLFSKSYYNLCHLSSWLYSLSNNPPTSLDQHKHNLKINKQLEYSDRGYTGIGFCLWTVTGCAVNLNIVTVAILE